MIIYNVQHVEDHLIRKLVKDIFLIVQKLNKEKIGKMESQSNRIIGEGGGETTTDLLKH